MVVAVAVVAGGGGGGLHPPAGPTSTLSGGPWNVPPSEVVYISLGSVSPLIAHVCANLTQGSA